MSDLKIGQLISTESHRDAIHVAVAPVVAAQPLSPGENVRLDLNGKAVSTWSVDRIGIVDPFLTGNVYEGAQFWLFLIPGSITSLRHDWTHPAFSEQPKPDHPEAGISRAWLESYAGRLDVTLEDLMRGVKNEGCISTDINYPSEVPDEFWIHYRIFTGTDVPPSARFDYFSCSC